MRLVPTHDNVLIKIAEPKTASGIVLTSKPQDEGVVIELGAICGKSERQGMEPGVRVLFDRAKARHCGTDMPDHVIVPEDSIQGMWLDEEESEASVDSN